MEPVVGVDSKGNWTADDLMEGIYEVVPDLPAGYISVDAGGVAEGGTGFNTGDNEDTFFSQQMVELMGGRADDDTKTFHIKDRNAGDGSTLTSVEVDGDACTRGAAATYAENQCGHDEAGSFSVVATASTGAIVRLSSSATDPTPTGTGTYSIPVRNGKSSTVTLSKPGSRRFFVHVTAADGYASNDASSEGFHLRRDADIRVKTVMITWDGDGLELDRDDLNLDPDGETDPVTGTTTLRYTVDKGDRGNAAPSTADALTLSAIGMNSDFGVDAWSAAVTSTEACSTDATGYTDGDRTATLIANVPGPPVVKGSVIHCFRINDTDGGTGDRGADANAANYATYRLILTRK